MHTGFWTLASELQRCTMLSRPSNTSTEVGGGFFPPCRHEQHQLHLPQYVVLRMPLDSNLAQTTSSLQWTETAATDQLVGYQTVQANKFKSAGWTGPLASGAGDFTVCSGCVLLDDGAWPCTEYRVNLRSTVCLVRAKTSKSCGPDFTPHMY